MSIQINIDVDRRQLVSANRPLPAMLVPIILFLADTAALVSVGASVYWNLFHTGLADGLMSPAMAMLIGASSASLGLFHLAGLYRTDPPPRLRRQAIGVLLCLSALAGLMLWLADLIQAADAGLVRWPVAWFVGTTAAILVLRALLALQVRQWATAGRFARRAVVVGLTEASARLIGHLMANGRSAVGHSANGYANVDIVGVFAERTDALPPTFAGFDVLGSIDRLPGFAQRHPIDDILIALPWVSDQRLTEAIRLASLLPVNVHLFPDLPEVPAGRIGVSAIGGVTLLDVAHRPLAGWDEVAKRAEDLLIGGTLLLILAPAMVLIAAAIKLTSPGPVFFKQRRFGFNNRVIEVLKFRTMYVDRGDPSGAQRTVRDDPRVTPVGRILRRTSLDELPQLINVVRGDMSIVGPRAHAVAMTVGRQLYHEAVSDYIARHRVRPGITGWAQVNGLRGEIDTLDKARRRIEYDLYYIDHWSIGFDLRIVARTALVLFFDRNAY